MRRSSVTPSHLPNPAQENDDGREVLTHERVPTMSKPCRAGAGAEHRAALAGDADVVLRALRLVGDFVQVGLVAADAHVLLPEPVSRPQELLCAL